MTKKAADVGGNRSRQRREHTCALIGKAGKCSHFHRWFLTAHCLLFRSCFQNNIGISLHPPPPPAPLTSRGALFQIAWRIIIINNNEDF